MGEKKKADAEFWREYLIEKRKAEEEQEKADTKLSIAIGFCMIAVFVLGCNSHLIEVIRFILL